VFLNDLAYAEFLRNGNRCKPLYIGVPSVTIPKKFRIGEIVKEHAAKFRELFSKHFKDA